MTTDHTGGPVTPDLPPHALACALELVDAVRCHSPAAVAHTLRQAAARDGLEALAVALAAMVDDDKSLDELLSWNDNGESVDVNAWRNSLTDAQCRDYHALWFSGRRDPDVADGEREYQKRRARRRRRAEQRHARQEAVA